LYFCQSWVARSGQQPQVTSKLFGSMCQQVLQALMGSAMIFCL
jgi:hypothetical protein